MENYIDLVKRPKLLSVQGFEALSVSEGLGLFFKEFGSGVDKVMAAMNSSVHVVDVQGLARDLEKRNVLYVKNTGVELLTPEGFVPGIGAMDHYVSNVIRSVYLASSLKTETSRLYDWIKQIIKTGRIDKSFNWTVTDFDSVVNEAEAFLKQLPENRRKQTYNLSQVYSNFNDYFFVVNKFNGVVKGFKAREIEMVAKDITRVYELGDLLVRKVKDNDITLTESSINDLQQAVASFTRFTNITGALLILLNETQAVLSSQANTLKNLK